MGSLDVHRRGGPRNSNYLVSAARFENAAIKAALLPKTSTLLRALCGEKQRTLDSLRLNFAPACTFANTNAFSDTFADAAGSAYPIYYICELARNAELVRLAQKDPSEWR
jgi:hypothetical protein